MVNTRWRKKWKPTKRYKASQELPIQRPGLEIDQLQHQTQTQFGSGRSKHTGIVSATVTTYSLAMILQHLGNLATKHIVLASSSPRRKEILQKIGLKFTVVPSAFEETLDPKSFVSPGHFVIATAKGKAEEVAKRLSQPGSSAPPPDLVIGADTCISLGGQVFGKPRDVDDAAKMLTRFSSRSHEVLTGVCVLLRLSSGGASCWQEICFSETTEVQFAELTQNEIKAYVDTGEPVDKAGGYGIQGLGSTLVEGIRGDYYNVMGFPLHQFCKHLSSALAKEGLAS